MPKILRITALALFFSIAVLAISPSYCQDMPKKFQIKFFEGRVSYIDWVTSKIRINGVGTMEFYVPKDAPIKKLGARIWLTDINILDNALIRYYEDPSGVSVVIDIMVTVV